MMNNIISKTELINIARLRAGHKAIDTLDNADPDARTANLLFKEVEDQALRVFPWKHAAKRVELQRLENGDITFEYNFRFKLPEDAVYIWHFYPQGGFDSGLYGRFFYEQAYSYYLATYGEGSAFRSNLGEIIRDEFHSNTAPIYCLYTFRGEYDYSKMDPQFIDVVKNALIERYLELKSLTAEEHTARTRSLEKSKREAKKMASIQNREAYSVQEPQIIQRLSRSLYNRRGRR